MSIALPQNSLLLEAHRAIAAEPHGHKGPAKKRWAEQMGISVETLERRLRQAFGRKRARRRDAGPEGGINEQAVREVLKIKKRIEETGEDARALPTATAIELAEANGLVARGAVSERTVNRVARSLGVTTKQPCVRWEAEYANQVHIVDGSGAEHLFPIEQTPDGDWVLGIRTSKEKKQKNVRLKSDGTLPEPGKRMLYYYIIVDAFSRVTHVHAVVARGESSEDNAAALEAAWRPKQHNPMQGLPDNIYTDNGPLGASEFGRTLCESLDIELVTHMPYNARAKGKAERPWRTMWQRFELQFLLHKGRTLLLSEVREMLANYVAGINKRRCPHRLHAGQVRDALYMESLGGRDVRMLPEDMTLLQLMSRSWLGLIDTSGCVRRENAFYEITDCPPVLLGEKAVCRMTLTGDVFVRNPDTGEWMESRPHQPIMWGDFHGRKHDENDALKKALDGEGPLGVLLYGEPPAADTASNVVSLRAVQIEKATTQGFASLKDGVEFFEQVLGQRLGDFKDPAMRAQMYELIAQNQHDVTAVKEKALELRKIIDNEGGTF